MIQALVNQIRLMLARAVVHLADDSKGIQELQATVGAGDVRARVERLQQFGFTGVPPTGSEALVVFVGGNRDHPVAVTVDSRSARLKDLGPGESAVYNAYGQHVVLREGSVELKSGQSSILIEDGKITLRSPELLVESPSVDFNSA